MMSFLFPFSLCLFPCLSLRFRRLIVDHALDRGGAPRQREKAKRKKALATNAREHWRIASNPRWVDMMSFLFPFSLCLFPCLSLRFRRLIVDHALDRGGAPRQREK